MSNDRKSTETLIKMWNDVYRTDLTFETAKDDVEFMKFVDEIQNIIIEFPKEKYEKLTDFYNQKLKPTGDK